MKKFSVVFFLFLIIGNTLLAQVKQAWLLNPHPCVFEKAEWDIKLAANFTNPYLQEEVALNMVLKSPAGKQLVLPCYYESGQSGSESIWKARFAPQERGEYSYYFLLSGAGKISRSVTDTFIAGASSKNGFLNANNNWSFQFDNHKPFRGIGENLAWESRASDDSKYFKALHENSKYNYEYMLRSLAAHGGNFYRTWICAWNLPVDWKNPVNSNRYTSTNEYYNPSAIAKMDRLVTLSDSLGVYMMLTLGEGASRVKDGGFAVSNADFFVNPQAKARYKNRLRYIIARWGYSTSIAAWELFNEVDNVQYANKDKPVNADSIVAWHAEMSAYIKLTDPYQHLVTTSISHRDLKGLNSIPTIDFNQKHIYKNTAAIPQVIVDYEQRFNKPYVIGEYGYEWDWAKNFDDFAADMDSDFKRGLWYGLFSPTPVLPMTWWWEYFDSRGTDAYLNNIKHTEDKMMEAGNGDFEALPVTASLPGIKIQSVKCGKTIFVYVYNPSDSAKTVSAGIKTALNGPFTVVAYLCENGKYRHIEKPVANNGLLQLKGIMLKPRTDMEIEISTGR
jgi:hypothetical protein